MKYNDVIKSDDPQAIEKLTDKLNERVKLQDEMKKANAHYRKHGTMQGYENLTAEQALRFDDNIKSRPSFQQMPYPEFELTNNNGQIRRIKQRIQQLSQDKELGFVGWKFNGGEAVINNDKNRLQLFFDEKPSDEQRTTLKRSGFRWSPSEGAWQRQLNGNAIYAANRIDFIQPETGQKPTELQPKMPKKTEPER